MAEFNHKIQSAIDDGDDAEGQIEDREFLVGFDEYRLVGKLPKKQLNAAIRNVVENALRGKWDFERDILGCVKTYLPNVRLKTIE